jgi:hypothetical protein
MALERQQSIIPHHAAPVIGDLDELFAARFDLYPDACRTRVQRILQKFLDHRSRAFDYLSGGDLVGHGLGKNVDFAHGQKIPRCARDFGRGLALCSRPHNASSFADADSEGKAENEKFHWLLGRINPEGVQVALG